MKLTWRDNGRALKMEAETAGENEALSMGHRLEFTAVFETRGTWSWIFVETPPVAGSAAE
jgi:hypothetical protein